MSAAIKAGVALAVAVEIFSVIFAVAGLHQKGPLFGIVFLLVVIGLNIGCIVWGLKQTSGENGYGKQLLNAIVIGLVAGVLIFVFSMVNLNVLFPNYLEESKLASIEFLENANLPEEVLNQQVAKVEGQTATGASIQGTIGAFFTSLIVGAIVAIFSRKK
jgi:hypothetical protein